jgi:hypothetical protein
MMKQACHFDMSVLLYTALNKKAERSPFTINKVELLVAIGTIVITRFGLHAGISSFWPVGLDLNTPLPD